MSLPVDMPVDVARKLSLLLFHSSRDYDELARVLRDATEKAGDGVSITVTSQ